MPTAVEILIFSTYLAIFLLDYKHMVSVGASNHDTANHSPSFGVLDNLFAANGSRVISANGNVNGADNGRQCDTCQQVRRPYGCNS